MKQKGFTLIELVVVIIILGILAVTALPKFVNLQGEARASTLQGMKAALEGASTLTFSKAAIQGKDAAATACVQLSGTATADCSGANEINVVRGYPKAAIADLEKVLDVDFCDEADKTDCAAAFEWHAAVAGTVVTVSSADFTPTSGSCTVTYAEAAASSRPAIAVTTDGC